MALVSLPVLLSAFAPTNSFRPYDAALRLAAARGDDPRHLGIQFEYGQTSDGRNWESKRSNVLQVHNASESMLSMLKDAATAKLTPAVANELAQMRRNGFVLGGGAAVDDGVRGHLEMTGEYTGWDVNFHAGYDLPFKGLPGEFSLYVYVPVVHRGIDDIKIKDLTKELASPQNNNTRRFLTDKATENIKRLAGIDLGNWERTGLGDVTVMLNWADSYRQEKEYLKRVHLHGKIGLSLPTSEEKDEDKAFSMPLGHDGAWGLPVGMGMQLDFIHNIRAGIDVDFLVLFDKSRVRRLKTNKNQTEHLLLNKGRATKEYGLTWQFHLYAEWARIFKGFSLGAAYQFVKHDDDRLNPRHNDFDYSMINSLHSLQEWNTHNILFKARYDFVDAKSSAFFAPQVSLFYKLPVAGKNVIDHHAVGGQVQLHF